jgi:uncharacterized metal-binding protein YceD (DUF177 family)
MLSSSQFHSDFATWAVSTHEVGVNGLKLSRLISIESFNAAFKEAGNELFSWQLVEASTIDFILTQENDKAFKVHACADLRVRCACVRCLEPVDFKLALDFGITMMEGSELGPDQTPGDYAFDSDCVESLTEDDNAVGYFLGRTIDLGLILREQIFLEVPDYPECQSPKAMGEATCKLATALLSTQMSTRENPFVKFWKTN